jgi:ATP-dependent exoDNAse (exonuclease V) beta subunit
MKGTTESGSGSHLGPPHFPLAPSRPFPHLIIRASAGSGKTYQLSSRFIALLAAGQTPDSILATTFTRKAAGEIFDRVVWRLAEAVTDDKKRAKLGKSIGDESLSVDRVRTLLVETLAALHRLRIGTLDSFFMKLAGSFALELGLPPGWRIGDEVEDRELREEAVEAILGSDRSTELLTLFHLLTKGEARRGIGDLVLDTVNSLYGLFRETEPEAWHKLTCKEPLSKEQLDELIGQMREVKMPNNSQADARNSDIEKALREDWKDLASAGLCKKVLAKETTYRSKLIPIELVKMYGQLLGHMNSRLVSQVIRQTEATHDLLTKFHEEYWRLKQESGSLRFDEVTGALAHAAAAVASPEQVAFRLDGQIGHILLDEFQDTSLPQWQVLRPLAKRVMEAGAKTRSFFCVGDVKQAIYGWRGGLAEMFDSLDKDLPGLASEPLSESFRSSPVVIDVVNRVFRDLPQHPNLEHYQDAVNQFSSGFLPHTTRKTELAGYVCLQTAPLPTRLGENGQDALLKFTAQQIAALVAKAPGRSIGVLCRKNDVVARMIFELKNLSVEASEEGGNPLTDSAAVELVISLLQIADHPGDTAARFHVASSPIAKEIGLKKFDDSKAAAKLSHELRTELLRDGYGAAIYRWARLLAPSCDRRELNRLQQLVEMAYDYQPKSTLRADAFVRLVQDQRKSDPSSANVRVMTIHQAKGLEFDAVFLPELDSKLLGQNPAFVAGRDSPLSGVNRVIRYAGDDVQRLLPPQWQQLFDEERDRRLRESLCTLYVAMTRSIHALHMIVAAPGERQEKNFPKTYAGMLRFTLDSALNPPPDTVLFEHGNRDWASKLDNKSPARKPTDSKSRTILLADAGRPNRGLVRASPSSLEGGARVHLGRLLGEKSAYGQSYGSLMHAWFEAIDWLDDGPPTDGDLRTIAAAVSARIGELPSRSLPLEDFRKALRGPRLAALLSRRHYELATGGQDITLEALRELPFAFRQEDQLLNGSIDRLVLVRQSGRLTAAEVIDFKTDTVTNPTQLLELTEFYRPQLEAYKEAAERITGLPAERITAKLVFLSADEVAPI